MMLHQEAGPVMLGLGLGTMSAAVVAARAASTLWFGIGAYDTPIYLGANLVVLAVAAAVAWTAALRVQRIDPVTAIRHT